MNSVPNATTSERDISAWAVLGTLCLGFFMVQLDLTIVNIAIPSILSDLHAGIDQVVWVVNAYTLAYAVLLITASRLGDRLGRRRLFAAGLAVFTIASALCGVAQSPTQLILARILQGLGGALLAPQSLAILTIVFPAERRGAALGMWSSVAGLAGIAGPTLGGALVTWIGWRSIFYINVPIGIAAIVLCFLLVPNLRASHGARLEILSLLLASAGLFCLSFSLIEGQKYGWGTIVSLAGVPVGVLVVLGASLVLLVLFLVWDQRQPQPLLPAKLFRDRGFAIGNWVGALVFLAMIGLYLPLTLYLQSVHGFSPIKAGLTLLPGMIASLPVAPVAGKLSDRLGAKYILIAGLVLYAAGMALIAWGTDLTSDWLSFLPGMVVVGLGAGCTFAPMSSIALRNVSNEMAGIASGVMNTTRQLGGVLGSALVGAVLTNALASALRSQAAGAASNLPPGLRQQFMQTIDRMAASGLKVPAAGGQPQVAAAVHDTFAHAFLVAMLPAMALPIALLVVGAASCLLIVQDGGRERTAESQRAGGPGEAVSR